MRIGVLLSGILIVLHDLVKLLRFVHMKIDCSIIFFVNFGMDTIKTTVIIAPNKLWKLRDTQPSQEKQLAFYLDFFWVLCKMNIC